MKPGSGGLWTETLGGGPYLKEKTGKWKVDREWIRLTGRDALHLLCVFLIMFYVVGGFGRGLLLPMEKDVVRYCLK